MRRAHDPASPPDSADPIAVAMSGGGFRATLPAVGVVRLLADVGLLPDLRYVSSVSGGSVANGMIAVKWPELRDHEFTSKAFDDLVVDPLVKRISSSSLKFGLIRGAWRTLGPLTRTDLLADRFDAWFFDGRHSADLDLGVRWIVSAANQYPVCDSRSNGMFSVTTPSG